MCSDTGSCGNAVDVVVKYIKKTKIIRRSQDEGNIMHAFVNRKNNNREK